MGPGYGDEVEEVVVAIVAAARADGRLRAVAICGSRAAGRARPGSDVDLVVVMRNATDRRRLADDPEWVVDALGHDAVLVRRQDWGPWMTEVRLRRASGLEVEVGLVDPEWASIAPVDPGTAAVVTDGFDVRHDPELVLAALLEAMAGRPRAAGGGDAGSAGSAKPMERPR